MRPSLGALLTAAEVLMLVWCTAGTAEARQPQPLERKSCELPEALQGMDGHVLLRYTVNEAGKINYVKPIFAVVDPPDKESDLTESVVTCLKGWSYGPAPARATSSVSGQPTGSVELLQAFHYFKRPTAQGETIKLEGGRSVPVVHIERMRALKVQLALSLLSGSDLFETGGQGWGVQTNVRPKERERLLGGVRFAMGAFEQVFTGAPSLPDSSRLLLLLFRTQDAFNQVAAFDNIFRGPKPAGQYSVADQMAYTFASGREHPLRLSVDYVVHETTHHLVHQRLAEGGRRDTPYWVDEGIASYIELLKPDKQGTFEKFEFRRGKQFEGDYSWRSHADTYLDAFERSLKAGNLPDFDDFINSRVTKMESDLAYGLSWILTHYLINGEAGALMKPFQAWLTGPMGGESDPGIAAAMGRSPQQLLEAITKHVAAMKRGG